MIQKPLLVEIKNLLADICDKQILKAKSWEDARVVFDELQLIDKRRLLEAKLAQTKKEKWHALVNKASFTQSVAEIMFDALNREKIKNKRLLNGTLDIIRIAEDELIDSIAEEVQFLLDAEVKKQFEKIKKAKASI